MSVGEIETERTGTGETTIAANVGIETATVMTSIGAVMTRTGTDTAVRVETEMSLVGGLRGGKEKMEGGGDLVMRMMVDARRHPRMQYLFRNEKERRPAGTFTLLGMSSTLPCRLNRQVTSLFSS